MRSPAPPRPYARTRLVPALLALALIFQLVPAPVATAAVGDTLKIYHPDFHARSSAKILATVTTPGAARLRISLKDASGAVVRSVADVAAPTTPDAQVAILDVQSLSAGSYTLLSEVLDAQGAVLDSKSEVFTRQIAGASRVYFDAANGVYVAGKPYFSVASYFGSSYANDPGMNSVDVEEYNNSQQYDAASMGAWLDRLAARGWMGIGPERSDPMVTDITPIVQANKDKPALLSWEWLDEPEYYPNKQLKGADVRVWTDISHANDPNHPVIMNTSGHLYADNGPAGEWNNMVAKWFTLDPLEAGQLPVDWYSLDFYPVGFQARLGLTPQQAFDAFPRQFVNFRTWTKDLVPFKAFIETNAMNPGDPIPTGQQVWSEVWTAIANGAKGITWFSFYGAQDASIPAVRANTLSYTNHFINELMAPDSNKVTMTGNDRIDYVAKEYNGKIYVFAASHDISTTNSITFNVAGNVSSVNVYGESRQVTPGGNAFTDTFAPYAVHIYEISPSATPTPLTGTMTVNGGAATTTSTNVALTSAVTGATQMRIDPGTGTYGASQPYAASTSITLPSTLGPKTVRVEYSDGAGSTLVLTGSVELVAPQTPTPTGTMLLNGGAMWSNSGAVTVDSSVSGATEMRVDSGSGFGAWRLYTPSLLVQTPAGDGAKTVVVEYRNGDSNVLALSDTINIDTAAPAGYMSVKDNGVNLVVNSSVAGATYMRVSTGTEFGAWLPYASIDEEARPMLLKSMIVVTVQYRDEAGNILSLAKKVRLRR